MGTKSVTSTTLSKTRHNRRHPFIILRNMLKNRRKAKLLKQNKLKDQNDDQQQLLHNHQGPEQNNRQNKKGFSIRKKNLVSHSSLPKA